MSPFGALPSFAGVLARRSRFESLLRPLFAYFVSRLRKVKDLSMSFWL